LSITCSGLLEWFRSYLSQRKQYSTATFSLLEILFGVPQESIIAPLLFLIYINDLPLATDLQAYLYADDTLLFNQADLIEALFNDTNEKLKLTDLVPSKLPNPASIQNTFYAILSLYT
jgi:hypothetical protein